MLVRGEYQIEQPPDIVVLDSRILTIQTRSHLKKIEIELLHSQVEPYRGNSLHGIRNEQQGA